MKLLAFLLLIPFPNIRVAELEGLVHGKVSLERGTHDLRPLRLDEGLSAIARARILQPRES